MHCYGARVNTTTDYRGEDNLVNDSFDDNHRTPRLALNMWDQELKKKLNNPCMEMKNKNILKK